MFPAVAGRPIIWSRVLSNRQRLRRERSDAVGAFSVNMTIPQLLNWTNMDAIETVTRATGCPSPGRGGDPNGTVYIFGF